MAANRGFLLLSLASRRGLLGADATLRIADSADAGGDVRALLKSEGRLKEADVKELEAEAQSWRSGRTKGKPTAGPSDETVALPQSEVAGHSVPVPGGQRYVLGDEIGHGGIARVVEAIDMELGRRVALKIIPADTAHGVVERFRKEARITGQLEHPNIVPVHEAGHLPGSRDLFYAMKRIRGRDMRQVIKDGSWSPRRMVEAFRDVCRAMAYAHSKGIIHRDLKPANVMLGDFGEVLVVDWGLAREVGPAMSPEVGEAPAWKKTPAGRVQGTPSYMSPEQAQGRQDEVDERSDVYSLGAMLYEILSGKVPYESSSPGQTIKLVLAGKLVPPSKIRPAPAELERICLQAMALKRKDRYGTVVEMGQEVEEFLQGTAR